MEDSDQLLLIQEIVGMVATAIEKNWDELMICCYVDDEQSDLCVTYLITQNNVPHEKSARVPHALDALFRALRVALPGGQGELFSSCKLHVFSDGRFDAKYGHGVVDWDGVTVAGWNFSHVTSLH